MVNRFHGTLYVSNSEMHGDTDWVRASDYDALAAELAQYKQWHLGGRSNVEFTSAGVRICRGDHDKNADCEWEEFVRPQQSETELKPHVYDNHCLCPKCNAVKTKGDAP